MKKIGFIILFITLIISSLFAQSDKKIALIIGNANYTNGGTLKNPVNDANLMEQTLISLNFEVIKVTNTTKQEMQNAIDAFKLKLTDCDVAFFYYAGHGMEINGVNYLIPVDAKNNNETVVRISSIALSEIINEFENYPNNTNIVILDACRNNPFLSASRGGSRGFVAVSPTSGTIIAFATAPGKTAADGDGNNGLYTSKLVKEMVKPQRIEDVFINTRNAVSSIDKNQNPQEWSQLKGAFYFVKPQKNATGNLNLTTEFSGKLYINNIYYSELEAGSQYNYENIPVGVIEIKIMGDKNWTEKTIINKGETKYINATKKTTLNVFVNSNPTNADFYLNDVYVGKTPQTMVLNYGTNNLKFSGIDLHEDTKTTLEISEHSSPNININLIPSGINAQIISQPLGASIKIDGKFYGQTPNTVPLIFGDYNLSLHKTGYQEFSQNISIIENKTIYNFNLMSSRNTVAEVNFNKFKQYRNTSFLGFIGTFIVGFLFLNSANQLYADYQTATTNATELHKQIRNRDILATTFFLTSVSFAVPIYIFNSKKNIAKSQINNF